jgi:RNA polymerase sigma-70 factor, ECF subfamily
MESLCEVSMGGDDETADETSWLASFHAGDRAVLENVYRECFQAVSAATSRILRDVDAETVTHEVFLRVLSDTKVRESFQGGNLSSWLARIATRAAIDRYRRLRRETEPVDDAPDVDPRRVDDEVEAKMLVERFRKEKLPPKWDAVFEARFLRQLPQREAARELGMQRSTLAYQEQQIRALLQRFLLEDLEEPS